MKCTFIKKEITKDDVGKSCLLPYSRIDSDTFSKLKLNTVYDADIKKANNPQFNAKFFVIAQTVVDNLPEDSPLSGVITTGYDLIKATERTLGYTKIEYDLNGNKHEKPESVSFGSWDQLRREEFFGKALPLWAEMIKCSVDELENNY